jgi:23S rRNA pseudouridine1911/1915/1917 synthase
MSPQVFKIDGEIEGLSLTRVISRKVERMSIRRAKALVDWGRVFVNERRILTGSKPLYEGDVVEVHPDRELTKAVLTLGAILCDSSGILVINKPAGISVYSSRGVTEETLLPLLERLLVERGRLSTGDRLTLVHRLDRDTTGALLVARNQEIARLMEGEFRQRTVKKRYLVLAAGSFIQRRFEQRSAVQAKRTSSNAAKRHFTKPVGTFRSPQASGIAITRFTVLEAFPGCALLEAFPETGRTHQIRIHLSRMGNPVLGDIRYGPQKITNPLFREIPRQMLHASSLGFRDPHTGQWIKVDAPIPRDMDDILERLSTLSPQ